MSENKQNEKDLVYGTLPNDILVFMPQQEALEKARVWQALNTAKTWGAFKDAIPDRFYEEVLELLEMVNEESEPDAEAPFDAEMIPGHADGDWPSWPLQEMLDWMPTDVQQRFGERVNTMMLGYMLRLQAADETEIVAAMEAHGYSCTRNDTLIRNANGWGEDSTQMRSDRTTNQ